MRDTASLQEIPHLLKMLEMVKKYHSLENVLSAGYPKKYPATSMSQDLLGTEVLLGTFRYIPGTLTGTLLRNV